MRFDGPHKFGVVQIAFGDQGEPLAKHGAEALHIGGELLHKVHSRAVDVLMGGVQPQRVAVVVLQPHQGVVDEKLPDLVTSALVEVHGRAPRCVVLVRQVRAEAVCVVPHRTEVVVDHVQHDCKVAGMTGVDKALKAFRPTVGFEDGEEMDCSVSVSVEGSVATNEHSADGVSSGCVSAGVCVSGCETCAAFSGCDALSAGGVGSGAAIDGSVAARRSSASSSRRIF